MARNAARSRPFGLRDFIGVEIIPRRDDRNAELEIEATPRIVPKPAG